MNPPRIPANPTHVCNSPIPVPLRSWGSRSTAKAFWIPSVAALKAPYIPKNKKSRIILVVNRNPKHVIANRARPIAKTSFRPYLSDQSPKGIDKTV